MNYGAEDTTRHARDEKGVEFFTIQDPYGVTFAAVQDEQGVILILAKYHNYLPSAVLATFIVQEDNTMRQTHTIKGDRDDIDYLFDTLRQATASSVRSEGWLSIIRADNCPLEMVL